MHHRIFYDRNNGSIEGLLTINRVEDDGIVTPIFKRIKARSGQWWHKATSWKRGKSPCPYGEHFISTQPERLLMEPVGTRFFPMCSDPKNKRLIQHPTDGRLQRWDIGLHRENRYPGSAGCIVIVDDAMAEKMFDYIETIPEAYVRFTVL